MNKFEENSFNLYNICFIITSNSKLGFLMKKRIIALLLTVTSAVCVQRAEAQYYFYDDSYYDNPLMFEIGGSVGAMNCLTDLGGKEGIGKRFVKDLNYGKTQTCYGAYLSFLYKNAVGVRLEANFGKLSADDAVLSTVPVGDMARTRYNRNLNFQTNITEFGVVAELHPFYAFINWDNRDDEPPKYSPYLLGGIGYYSFNPQALIDNKLIDLQPLSTEGQGLKEYPDKQVYKLKQINFPIGMGLKYELSPLVNIRGEFQYRILSTDYLDDCSTDYVDPSFYANNGFSGVRLSNALLLSNRQINNVTGPGGKRGSPTQKDSYFSFNIRIGLNLGRERIN